MKCKNCRWYNIDELDGACEILTKRDSDGICYMDKDTDCKIPYERECCTNCKLYLNMEAWDYSVPGVVDKHNLPGYTCMLFAHEGTAVQMIGIDPNNGMCECFSKKR